MCWHSQHQSPEKARLLQALPNLRPLISVSASSHRIGDMFYGFKVKHHGFSSADLVALSLFSAHCFSMAYRPYSADLVAPLRRLGRALVNFSADLVAPLRRPGRASPQTWSRIYRTEHLSEHLPEHFFLNFLQKFSEKEKISKFLCKMIHDQPRYQPIDRQSHSGDF
jgi:hypothetical protein